MKYTLLTILLGFSISGSVSAEEKWRRDTTALFEVFADAMVTAKYSALFEALDDESSDEYRQLMLVYYGLMSPEERSHLPAGQDGKPISLEELGTLTNEEFWHEHINIFRKSEEEISKKLRAAHGSLGTPTYVLSRAFRDGDHVFMLVEKTFDIRARAPLPYEVLEAKFERGHWRLRVPRGMTWKMQEDISTAKAKLRTG